MKVFPSKQFCFFLLCYCFTASPIFAQNINFSFDNQSIITGFTQIEQQTDYTFAYNNGQIPTELYTIQEKNLTLEQALRLLLKKTDLKYELIGNQILIIKKAFYEVYGIIKDASTNEALPYAVVYLENKHSGVTTNEYGYYSVNLIEGDHVLVASYLGMKPVKFKVHVSQRKRLDINLEPKDFGLDEVVISEPLQTDLMANLPLNQTSILDLAKSTPHIGGEPDLLHVLRAKAGVQSSAGGIGGLYVRGGDTGHNLILLDGVPVYNAMHLLGMNSIFSPDAVRGVQFHTSNFSARHGGRLASVIDIQSKEGDPEKYSGHFGISQRSIHGQFSGPLFNPKGAFWISGRHSLLLPYVREIIAESFYESESSNVSPTYYDFNVKINQQFGKNDRLYLSYYEGKDDIAGGIFTIDENLQGTGIDNVLAFGNSLFALRWNHIYNNNLFSNLTVTRSRFFNEFALFYYSFKEELDDENSEFFYSEVYSNNEENSLKLDFDWSYKDHQIKFGGSAHLYTFEPFITVFNETSEDIPSLDSLSLDSLSGNFVPRIGELYYHTALYVEDDFPLTDKINLRLGLRFTTFSSRLTPLYAALEPRFLLTAKLNEQTTLNLSINRMVQYLHLVSNADIGLPRDLWLPSDEIYEPSSAWQYDASIQLKPINNWRTTFSIYYKSMDNLLALPDSITAVSFGASVRNQLLTGQGNSYGVEGSTAFENDKWSAFASYALSWANRTYERINLGKAFPFQFDTRHYFQLILSYEFAKNWQIGWRGHFSTPRPLLVSAASNSLDGGLKIIDLNESGKRNQIKSNYEHRIDLNINFTKQYKRLKHQASFEVYNVYRQTNPVFYYLENTQPTRQGLTLPIMFALYYSLSF